ncbi:MAG: TetR/AcrR family transcriptional regulator [Terracidiphilus sp.]|nr:TetR/AcrR family transcriptional regulator [Terracidiphilus sp.]MDR3776335.1 TetR/AcrR family transcriptional regulator [Terracidiphilus sp.]
MPLVLKPSVRTDRIVQAAGQLFSHQGFHGTSTREIARLADVSENTLFRHFEHKEDLFWSALRSHAEGLKLRGDLLEGIEQCGAPEVVLPKILELFTDTASYQPVLLRLLAVAFLELQWKAEAFCLKYLSPVFTSINDYLAMSIESGRIRAVDSTMLTTALLTTALMHPEASKLIWGSASSNSDGREVGRAYAQFWLDVLAPKPPLARRPTSPRVEEYSS